MNKTEIPIERKLKQRNSRTKNTITNKNFTRGI